MQVPLSITFRDMDHSDALEAYVRKRSEKLERFSSRITGCHVTIEIPHRHQHSGRLVRVSIDMSVPGGEILVNRARDEDSSNQDAYAAVDQAFDRAGRRLQDYVRQQRGDVKPHEQAYREGRITKLWAHEGYGFLSTGNGDEVYFHRNSVLHHAFDQLRVGAKCRFIEEMGERGAQASAVVLSG